MTGLLKIVNPVSRSTYLKIVSILIYLLIAINYWFQFFIKQKINYQCFEIKLNLLTVNLTNK